MALEHRPDAARECVKVRDFCNLGGHVWRRFTRHQCVDVGRGKFMLSGMQFSSKLWGRESADRYDGRIRMVVGENSVAKTASAEGPKQQSTWINAD